MAMVVQFFSYHLWLDAPKIGTRLSCDQFPRACRRRSMDRLGYRIPACRSDFTRKLITRVGGAGSCRGSEARPTVPSITAGVQCMGGGLYLLKPYVSYHQPTNRPGYVSDASAIALWSLSLSLCVPPGKVLCGYGVAWVRWGIGLGGSGVTPRPPSDLTSCGAARGSLRGVVPAQGGAYRARVPSGT